MDKDIIVIGGGPGGYVAAIRAAQLGAKVSVIEKRDLGGTCLNRGCIPTKVLCKNAEILHTLNHIEDFGVKVSDYSIDVEKIQQRKGEVIDKLVGGVSTLLQANGVDVLRGEAVIEDKNTVRVKLQEGGEKEITTKNLIIATGSEISMPPISGINLPGVIGTDELLEFKEIPKRLVVIGSGVIGIEFANIFKNLGSEVTIFSSRLLKRTDSDISKRFTAYIKKQGVKVNNLRASEICKTDNGLLVKGQSPKGEVETEADVVLVASGRVPCFGGIDLERLGIEYDEKGIKVDEYYETNVKGIYAIGDVIGGMMLAHAASNEGIKAVERIMGVLQAPDNAVVPDCIFASPEIAYVGLTEQQAKEKGLDYEVSKFMFGANGKALALGEPDGFVKVIATKEEKIIIGVHIMGPHASDLIHEGTLAISKKLNARDIASTVHAHPTLSEAFYEAVLGLNGEAIHMVPAKR
ncbi:dihydrolipoyl dehydrogenase [Clostridium culturomicium]|uniref:dihydrolipoyl dehydrogenase n=1 Tax=Clostridium culturomicium TaxID=1499683 RepID=UPI00058FBC1E|nr:dihydrolipoyl dehydrogenase [Clostridium culturomicium]